MVENKTMYDRYESLLQNQTKILISFIIPMRKWNIYDFFVNLYENIVIKFCIQDYISIIVIVFITKITSKKKPYKSYFLIRLNFFSV